ncbi:MAG: I78 family peptidase inhibitor [Pseudomonadota bacterium]
MARTSLTFWGSLGAAALLAACNPAPPFEEVSDPFAPLPQAKPVTTGPIATPGVISDEVIAPATGPIIGTGPIAGSGPVATVQTAPLNATGTAPAETPTAEIGAGTGTGIGTGIGIGAETDDPSTPGDTVLADGPGGLLERLPNTCQLENYQQYQDTDGLVAVGLVTDRPARLVAPGDIVSQVYDPQRVNFYTNTEGRVVRISCG